MESKWTAEKARRKRKIEHLVNRYAPKTPARIEGIAVSDSKLCDILKPQEEPVFWGEEDSRPLLTENERKFSFSIPRPLSILVLTPKGWKWRLRE